MPAYADDAYLIAAFPGLVVRTPEVWQVTILDAQAGAYTVTMMGVAFPFVADLADTTADIMAGLVTGLQGPQTIAAASPVGAASFTLSATSTAALGLTVEGPAVDTIVATLASGGDSNAAQRAFWLEQVKCDLIPECLVTCAGHYTMMHAALAASHIYSVLGLGMTGMSAAAWDSMGLGPARITKGKTQWTDPADAELATTWPGLLYLSIRAKYLFGVMCA